MPMFHTLREQMVLVNVLCWVAEDADCPPARRPLQ